MISELGWQTGLLSLLRTGSQILSAGVAITAFSLLLYAFAFNLRDRVARSFAIISIILVIIFSADTFSSVTADLTQLGFWLRFQWVGIIFLPAAYMHFSDALLTTTGKPSQGRRRLAVRMLYLFSLIFIFFLPGKYFLGEMIINKAPAPHLQPTWLTSLFLLYYLIIMMISVMNFLRAYRRTLTKTSRRRMGYLIAGSIAPALGSFPFLLYSSNFAAVHPIIFWFLVCLVNVSVATLVVVMAYTVAFFGVSWTDRVVKSRLFKWLMRGPATASLALAFTTLVRQSGAFLGLDSSALVPIVMIITILLCEYLITLLAPLGERLLFYGNDSEELEMLRNLEERLLTRNDLKQFLELILAALCDRLQAPGAYIVAFETDGLELVVTTGKTFFDEDHQKDLLDIVTKNENLPDLFQWGNDYIIPLKENGNHAPSVLVGFLGISKIGGQEFNPEQLLGIEILTHRAALALGDRKTQRKIFQSLEDLTPQVEIIQSLRAAGTYDRSSLLDTSPLHRNGELVNIVKEALTHYWGGPRLTNSPLMKLRIVQQALAEHSGNYPNALRAILKRAIEQVRPEGDRRFTGEWILYNILEMKFVEGRKVREIASRLAMSEADLYRKQRIAIEAVSNAIQEMETLAQDRSDIVESEKENS